MLNFELEKLEKMIERQSDFTSKYEKTKIQVQMG